MTQAPDDLHFRIEAMLRGITQLLPSEGFDDWAIQESSRRNALTKVVRLTKNAEPRLVFERLGGPLNFWLPTNTQIPKSAAFTSLELRRRGVALDGSPAKNGSIGSHSNVWSFFRHDDELWNLKLENSAHAWQLLKCL